jgi:general secretion pathway protein L
VKFIGQIFVGLSRWLDSAASAIVAIISWAVPRHGIELVETESGAFTVVGREQATFPGDLVDHLPLQQEIASSPTSGHSVPPLKGSRVALVLRPSRFMFRQLELPSRASEFIEGIIRAQIDRLTPWGTDDALFGWSEPKAIPNGRIIVTVAATARTKVAPFVQAVTRLGAESVAISTFPETSEHGSAGIKILDHETRQAINIQRVRGALAAILTIVVLAAGISIGAATYLADDLSARQDDLSRRIGDRRAALRAGLDATGNSALAKLERRKHEQPAVVIVLDELAKVLPDDTYVTELRFEGKSMQVIGFTRDAAALIALIEQAPQFTGATFFAPTIRSPDGVGERFHVEIRLAQSYGPRS